MTLPELNGPAGQPEAAPNCPLRPGASAPQQTHEREQRDPSEVKALAGGTRCVISTAPLAARSAGLGSGPGV